MFTVTGSIDGLPASLTYDATRGEGLEALTGDAAALARVVELVGTAEELALTATGPTVTAALDPAWVALVTMLAVMDAGAETLLSGDPPAVPTPEIPPGAVA